MKTLKDLLRAKGRPVTCTETAIYIENVRTDRRYRRDLGDLAELGRSIESDGLREPITIWSDGTLISGSRRLAAHFSIASLPGNGAYRQIRAFIVDTIEDAAKRLMIDNGNKEQAVPLKPSEMAALWETLRALDEPAAAQRLTAARRQGVELRRQTQAGQRPPGRSRNRGKGDEYVMSVLAEPFGMAEATASRLWAIYRIANTAAIADDRRAKAVQALAALDDGQTSIWACYAALVSGTRPIPSRVRATPAAQPAPAARQRATWDRALPQMEGLVAGLAELGPPHPDQTWEQVGPVHARLMKIRRDLEKIINGMKETARS